MNQFQRKAMETIRNFWFDYWEMDDPQRNNKVLSYMDDRFVALGTAKKEVFSGKNIMFLSLLEDQMEHFQGKIFILRDEWYRVQELDENFCVVYGGFLLKGRKREEEEFTSSLHLRYSIVCGDSQDGVKFHHVHISMPSLFRVDEMLLGEDSSENGSAVLIKQIEKKNREIEFENKKHRELEMYYEYSKAFSDEIMFIIDMKDHMIEYDRWKLKRLYNITIPPFESGIYRTYKDLLPYIHKDDRARYEKFSQNFLDPGTIELRMLTDDGNYVWISDMTIPVLDEHDRITKIIIHIKNIDAQKRKEEELSQRAKNDALTGLLNRAELESQINSHLKVKDASGVLFMIDLDNFKIVNDSKGHIYGDHLLRKFAELLTSTFLPEDIIGRVGGDEFVVLVKRAYSHRKIMSTVKDLICSFREALDLELYEENVSCSIGVAIAPFDGKTFDILYSKADKALYDVKTSGKGNFAIYKED